MCRICWCLWGEEAACLKCTNGLLKQCHALHIALHDDVYQCFYFPLGIIIHSPKHRVDSLWLQAWNMFAGTVVSSAKFCFMLGDSHSNNYWLQDFCIEGCLVLYGRCFFLYIGYSSSHFICLFLSVYKTMFQCTFLCLHEYSYYMLHYWLVHVFSFLNTVSVFLILLLGKKMYLLDLF